MTERTGWFLVLLVLGVLVLWTLPSSGAQCGFQPGRAFCLGDRNCDCQIQVAEIQKCINVSLYGNDQEFCSLANPWCASVQSNHDASHCDRNCDFDVTVAEIQTVINNSLNGCGSPCYSGFNYPVFPGSQMCTYQVFSQLFCQPGVCQRANCAAC